MVFIPLFISAISVFAVSPTSKQINTTKTALIRGIYRYTPKFNTPDEDFYIVIDNASQGRIYCTSDMIEVNSREGYEPGFFVANMNGMKTTGDSLHFSITLRKEDYFTKPFPLSLRSSADVRKQGGMSWTTGSTFDSDKKPTVSKNLSAKVSGDSIVFRVDYLKAISGGKMIFKRVHSPTKRSRGALR